MVERELHHHSRLRKRKKSPTKETRPNKVFRVAFQFSEPSAVFLYEIVESTDNDQNQFDKG
jgi:hypothetical protein